MPCDLKFVKNSGSVCSAASVSYCNSSESLVASATSATKCLQYNSATSTSDKFGEDLHEPSPKCRAETENALDAFAAMERVASVGRTARVSERDAVRTANARVEQREA